MKLVILASQSPRRKDLLERMGLQFQVIPSDFDEQLDHSRSPEEVAKELALSKALTVAREHPDALVIGADTIVTINGQQLAKPHDATEAVAMLRLLSGGPHTVTTGLAVLHLARDRQLVAADTAIVVMRPFDQQAVETYVQTGDPLDKAGGYGIQSGAAPLVDHFVGSADTILGLPTKLLAEFLAQFGITAQAVQVKLPVRNTKS